MDDLRQPIKGLYPVAPNRVLALTPDTHLTPTLLADLVDHKIELKATDTLISRIKVMAERVEKLIQQERPVYGLTTGFGPLIKYPNKGGETNTLQRHLIYHLATGTGEAFDYREARSLLIARLFTLLKGHSGASVALIRYLLSVVNRRVAPFVPQKGTVGASGDLTPSAHMALAIFGEGRWIDESNRILTNEDFENRNGLAPFMPAGRDPLCLVNGTSCMTGLTGLGIVSLENLIAWAQKNTASVVELMGCRKEAYSEKLSALRGHAGQEKAARFIRAFLQDSCRLKSEVAREELEDVEPSFQAPYSLRCIPQVFGAFFDFSDHAIGIVERELNAVTDNPVIIKDEPFALHGGNFYGQHTAFAADILNMALTKVAILVERQLDLMCDPNRNGGLPDFLVAGRTGINSGLMGAQVTASALLAEMRTQATGASLQSVPTNGHNQDINTMGTTAARLFGRNLKDFASILAIHSIALAEMYDRLCEGQPSSDVGAKAIHPNVREHVAAIRSYVAPLLCDRPLSEEISDLSLALMTGLPSDPADHQNWHCETTQSGKKNDGT